MEIVGLGKRYFGLFFVMRDVGLQGTMMQGLVSHHVEFILQCIHYYYNVLSISGCYKVIIIY